jgi:hypothetical protein
MTQLESVCRVLRDLGIFLMGIATIIVAIDYLFIRPDPVRDMQRVLYRSFTEDLEKRLKQPNISKHSENGSEAPPFETRSGQ